MFNQKLIENMTKQLNNNHKNDVEEYILTMNRIDKVAESTILTNVQSILAISRNTKKTA